MSHADFNERPRRVYRDSERGLILGVCAGLAGFLDCPVWLIRIGAIGIGWFFPIPVGIAYLVAALLMRERPLHYYGQGDERSFWQSRNHRS